MPQTNMPKYINGSPVAGSILIYDGCNWNFTTLAGSFNCADIQNCISTSYVMSLIANSPSVTKIGNTFNVNVGRLNANINSSFTNPSLTIGNQTHNLQPILNLWNVLLVSGTTQSLLENNDQLRFTPLDGLRQSVINHTWGTEVTVGLPTANRQANYVLTRNGTTAVWRPACDPCCDQIQKCMEPIIEGLQNQINNLVSLIGSTSGGSPEDYTISSSFNVNTGIATFNRVLGGTYTLDLNPLINSFSDNFVSAISLAGTVLTLDMVTGPDLTVDLSSLVGGNLIVSDEGNVVNSATTSMNFIGNGVTVTNGGGGLVNVNINDIYLSNVSITGNTLTFNMSNGTSYNVNIPNGGGGGGGGTDELIKITNADTNSDFLFGSIGNTVTTNVNNDGTIKKRVNNPGANETLQLIVDLATYNGNTNFIGNHTQNGTQNLNGPVNIGAGPLTYTNTVTSGTQQFNTNYGATYNNSTINYTNGTVVNQDNTSVYNNAGTTNYNSGNVNYTNVTQTYSGNNTTNLTSGSTLTNNLNGTVNNNHGSTYTQNNTYQAGSTINNNGTQNVNNTNLTQNITGGTTNYLANQISCVTNPVFATPFTAPVSTQFALVKLNYNNGNDPVVSKTIRVDIGVNATEDFVTLSNTGTISFTWSGQNLTVTVSSGNPAFFSFDLTEGICWYNNAPIINNQGATINNTGTVVNGGTYTNTTLNNVTIQGTIVGFTSTPVILNTSSYNAQILDYIVVTNLGATTINLPTAVGEDGKTIKIKKFTGEDVFVITINPFGTETIDGFTSATMNINRTMYTFTAINGNWYLGD